MADGVGFALGLYLFRRDVFFPAENNVRYSLFQRLYHERKIWRFELYEEDLNTITVSWRKRYMDKKFKPNEYAQKNSLFFYAKNLLRALFARFRRNFPRLFSGVIQILR